ncbi:MAG: Stk1 family PASTA domain-containing Ser/Thr kinase [Clostridia bacterium]|nr:Stk1 family PASTA domain-containing Ser/Thr kinase [Clostridia bacterium]
MKDLTGQLLSNRYSVIEKIGVGGMAEVYKAYCNTLNRFVAVKIIKDELKNEEDSVKRFKTESRAVAILNHPNIVSVYDVGVFDGRPFIVMELIEGITLKEYMSQKGIIDYKEAIFLIAQVLRALEHAHNRKIIHRDIKPQNIMLLKDGVIKVADFGIARFAASNTLTMTDSAIGTAHYLSPEQARGTITDEKSDIYSVGVMLYEMTTGRVPFDSDNPVSVALMHLSATPARPREINPNIPEGFEEIILKAMSRDPKNRYANVEEMMEDFELVREEPSVTFDYVYNAEEESEDAGMPTQKIEIGDSLRDIQKKEKKPEPEEDDDEYEPAPITSERNRQKPQRTGKTGKSGKTGKGGRTKRPSYLKNVAIAAVGVVVLVAILMNVVFPAIFGEDRENSVTVPMLEGKTVEEVENDFYGEYKDFEISVVQRINDPMIPEGVIISQSPKPDSVRKKGSRIELIVSAGERTETVPAIEGMEYRYAKVELENKGFTVTRVDAYSESVPSDSVISAQPAGYTVAPYGSEVILNVSIGKESVKVQVPLIVGMSQDSAKSAILASGLSIGEIKQEISEEPRGEVISQTLTYGSTVDELTPMGFTVSLGEEFRQELEIVLPEEPETQVVRVTQNGTTIYEEMHRAEDGRITLELSGTGTAMISIYINGGLYYEKVVRFEQE